MDMVAHQAIGPNLDLRLAGLRRQQVAMDVLVAILEKDRLTPVPRWVTWCGRPGITRRARRVMGRTLHEHSAAAIGIASPYFSQVAPYFSRVEFVKVAPGRYERIAATRSVMDMQGMFGPATKPLSIEDMNAIIARHVPRLQKVSCRRIPPDVASV
jgi:hypothetical protein